MFSLQPTTPQSNTHTSRLRQITGAGNYYRPTWTTTRAPLSRRQVAGNRHKLSVRAVISSEESKRSTVTGDQTTYNNGGLVSPEKGEAVEVKAVITIRKKMKEKIGDKIEDQWESFITGIGQGILIQLISEDIDPVTKSGKSIESYARGWLPKQSNHRHIVEYAATLTVPSDFGNPGAILVTNFHGKEFHLMQIVLHGFSEGRVVFPANTWIHSRKDNPESRIIFKSQTCLPSKTPPGLKDLRREDLLSVRGNGKGVRKPHDRIYDYAPYNDLGNPDKGEELVRPVLGGVPGRPYPRRCRTGRPPTKSDPLSESRIEKPHPVYVPRDETFEEIKQNTFAAGRLKSLLHNLIPLIAASLSSSDISFGCFSEIDKLYIDGVVLPNDEHNDVQKKQIMPKLLTQVLTVGDRLLKYEIPAIIRRDMFAWTRDNEFARQALAGVNPVNIEVLREFPILSKLDPADYGPQESAITKELLSAELQGITIEEAIEKKRLFIIDYHDMLLPFIGKMNTLPGRKAYASRTILFLTRTGVLKPIVIELSLPPKHSSSSNKRVFTHGHDATAHWMWKQAKAHVCSNDAGVHQLVNHWLRTHACMEAYIIATHRQLSSMHPIFKLLHPHMRYTLEINAIARQNLINGGGIIEACFSPGKYAMEISSAGYKSWRFDMESLPADLIRRGMAVEDPSKPHGLKLLIEDYPYAADGLLVWSAIKELVEPYVAYYYSEPNSITSDIELQAWWTEIKNKGHYDKRNEPWWPKLETKEDLSGILTIIIWTASGQHAAINFGQYPFGGYVPNRPTLMRKLIPTEEDPEYEIFLHNPQRTFLSSLPTQLQATKIMAVQDTLSTHSADEEYLGQLHHLQSHWGNDPQVLKLFEKFSAKVEEIEKIINKRNKDTSLKNRNGAGVPPYELLLPTSGPGVTGRGIPNSVSI